MVTSELRAEVSCIRNASGHNYRNSSGVVDLAMGQILHIYIPRSTERISSIHMKLVADMDQRVP